jgi:hypothetical protein
VAPSDVKEVVANAQQHDTLQREDGRQVGCQLVVGEPVQEPACLDLFQLFHDIAVAAARGGSDNVLVEGPWDEYDEDEEVDHCADGAHGLRAAGHVSSPD